jgi:hypothetical protein
MKDDIKKLDCLIMVDKPYFAGKLQLVIAGLENYNGDELARELHRLANTASDTLPKWEEQKHYEHKSI